MGFNVVITWPALAGTAVLVAVGFVGLYLRMRRRRARARVEEFD